MKILIVNCHWNNHGDEAAIRSMIFGLQEKYPHAEFFVQKAIGSFEGFPADENITIVPTVPRRGLLSLLLEAPAYLTNGRINICQSTRAFYSALKDACMVLHAPGGPSIGDIYMTQEKIKLKRLMIIRRSGVPYAFYAPSMGPFENRRRNRRRKKILEGAAMICLREDISLKHLKRLCPSTRAVVTLDSAFQHEIDIEENKKKYEDYQELNTFIGNSRRVIGVTITDLQWNALFRDDGYTARNIRETFSGFVKYLTDSGYKVLFIPQLFGSRHDDYTYMRRFAIKDCFVMDDQYDCFFQQYVISRIKAVVGMRYHSNIFSAKMGTPFVSISYEQKMKGFMEKAGLLDYCLDVNDLSADSLKSAFCRMMNHYDIYKSALHDKKDDFISESGKTTEIICWLIKAYDC